MQYVLKKEDKTISIVNVNGIYNYKKEFGTLIVDAFDFSSDKLSGLLNEAKELGYKSITGPEPIIDKYGNKKWVVDGNYHREDGPAFEGHDGTKIWYIENKRHRLDGPACEYSDGEKVWFQNDVMHRLDGPALEYPCGDKEWYVNGRKHRDDGPAVELYDGGKEWWINGKELTEEEFNKLKA